MAEWIAIVHDLGDRLIAAHGRGDVKNSRGTCIASADIQWAIANILMAFKHRPAQDAKGSNGDYALPNIKGSDNAERKKCPKEVIWTLATLQVRVW